MNRIGRSRKPKIQITNLTFAKLVSLIRGVHQELAAQAGRAVNATLTLRNWLIGYYIAEYELKGADRARYGERLFKRLSLQLQKNGVSRAEERELRRYRQFYQVYPQIRDSLNPEFQMRLPSGIRGSPNPESRIRGEDLLSKLSFTHTPDCRRPDSLSVEEFDKARASGVLLCWSYQIEVRKWLHACRAKCQAAKMCHLLSDFLGYVETHLKHRLQSEAAI